MMICQHHINYQKVWDLREHRAGPVIQIVKMMYFRSFYRTETQKWLLGRRRRLNRDHQKDVMKSHRRSQHHRYLGQWKRLSTVNTLLSHLNYFADQLGSPMHVTVSAFASSLLIGKATNM